MSFDNLGDRMKDYENVPRISLTKKMPVIIRLDGKAFHSFTREMKRPFDSFLIETMQKTAQFLCENVMNCKLAYTQSDEISLLLIDYEKPESQQWFQNSIQKMVSVAASMATLEFNRFFRSAAAEKYLDEIFEAKKSGEEAKAEFERYEKKFDKAMFDARAFTLPKEEVCNYFIWRQQDAIRNSIQIVAQSLYSEKQLHGKNTGELKGLMIVDHGVNWEEYPTHQKRGTCIVKEYYDKNGATRSRWIPDVEIPIFTQDRDYIDKYVFVG